MRTIKPTFDMQRAKLVSCADPRLPPTHEPIQKSRQMMANYDGSPTWYELLTTDPDVGPRRHQAHNGRMMTMQKIDIAEIEATRSGETVNA